MIGVGLYSCSSDDRPAASPKRNLALAAACAPLLRLRNRRDQVRPAPAVDDAIGRLPVGVELPVPAGKRVRRVEDRALEELLRHELVVESNLGTDLNVLSAPKESGRSPNARHASMNCLSPR